MLKSVWGHFYCLFGLFYLSEPTKDNIVKAVVFPIIMYGCESWMWDKEGRALRNWCFWMVVLEKTLESPLESKIKPVNLKGNPEYSLEELMLKLKLQYFGHLIRTAESLERTLMLGKIEGKRRRGWQRNEMIWRHHWFNGLELGQILGVGAGQGCMVCCSLWGHEESDTTWYWTITATVLLTRKLHCQKLGATGSSALDRVDEQESFQEFLRA